jgi:hypothetical protein
VFNIDHDLASKGVAPGWAGKGSYRAPARFEDRSPADNGLCHVETVARVANPYSTSVTEG